MKVIGLVGYTDKYAFAINLAKSLVSVDKSVLVVDGTNDNKLKYVIPSIDNIGKSYVTQYNNVDFAVGFESMYDVENYMCEQGINIGLYDYILIDIDSPKTYEYFRTRGIDRIFFFVETSVLAVAKNKELIKAIRVYNPDEDTMKLNKVVFRDYMSRTAEDYFEKQISSYGVTWKEPEYEVFMDEKDKIIDSDSQFSGIIDLKKHSPQYLNLIAEITANIMEDINYKTILKQIKRRKD